MHVQTYLHTYGNWCVRILHKLMLPSVLAFFFRRDYLRLSFDSTRRDSRRIEYSTSTGDAEKLKDILLPYATHNKQNMIISPRYEVGTYVGTYAFTSCTHGTCKFVDICFVSETTLQL